MSDDQIVNDEHLEEEKEGHGSAYASGPQPLARIAEQEFQQKNALTREAGAVTEHLNP